MSPVAERSTLARAVTALVSIAQVLVLRELTLVDRFRLVSTAIRAWTRMGERDHHLSFPRAGTIHLVKNSLNADWNVLSEVFLTRCYRTDYRAATAIDVGAHKGYFGAFAFLGGARTVVSYEPERQNFSCLERAANSFRDRGFDWRVEKKALAARSGETELKVSGESWTHSLFELPEEGRRRAVGSERVTATTLHEVLADLATHEHHRVIIKIDVEGAECDLILGTATDDWARVDELFVETHPYSSCSGDEIISHLEMAGLTRQNDSTEQITHLKRR
jgi:FkbM family methyltransferase